MSMLIALVAMMMTASSFAFTAPSAPSNGWYVMDQTGRMSTPEISALNQKIKRISEATHNEFGIALIQSLDGDTIEDAAYNTFKKWGIGKHGLDNGVLIMVSLKDRKSRIETGKGVGGEITDIQAKQILESMHPQLRSGNFAGAFNQALDGVSSLLESRANQQATPVPSATQSQATSSPPQPTNATKTNDDGIGESGFFLLFFFGVGVVGFVLYLVFRDRKRYDYDVPSPTRQASYPTYEPTYRSTYTTTYNPPVAQSSYVPPPSVYVEDNSLATAAIATAAILEEQREARREEREERRQEREERREERQESSSSFDWGSSSSSSSDSGSSWDSGSSSGGSFDSGGGFDGGSSGGGGSSDSW